MRIYRRLFVTCLALVSVLPTSSAAHAAAQAIAVPGQGAPAVAPTVVTLTPVGGDFGLEEGSVLLVSNDTGDGRSMGVVTWTPGEVTALLPSKSPGSGNVGETFTIQVAAEEVFEATPVSVLGPPGSGYPPTH